MNQRLNAIYRMIGNGRGMIDVGTDHGLIPERLAREGYPGRIFASDINVGPLAAAKQTAAASGVENRICFLLSDGLDACPPEAVDCIVIAGMGGDTICGILDRAEWTMDAAYRLILQPMSKAEVLRYWLTMNGFRITEEQIVAEGDTFYQIFAAVYCGENEKLSDAELLIGKQGLADPALYRRLAERHILILRRRIAGIESGEDPEKRRKLPALWEILRQMEEIRREDD